MKYLYFENNLKIKFGYIFFYLGIFLLPSAVSISVLLLLVASGLGFLIQEKQYLQDKWNFPFLIATAILIISSLFNSFFNNGLGNSNGIFDINSHIGLFNWVPFLFSFFGFQAYLKNANARKKCSLLFLAGTLPVIFSIVGQTFLNLHGPFQTLNGLIVWYQRPIDGIMPITGLFNNPNYLGSWLMIVWPFCLASCIQKNISKFKKIISLIFLILIASSILLSASRAAWLAFILSIPLILGIKKAKFFLPIFIFIVVLTLSIFIPIFGSNTQEFLKELIPIEIWSNFSPSNYANDISRFDIWHNSLSLIAKNPILGSGFSSFPNYLESQIGVWKGHSHNLILELMTSYGIPAALLITIPFTLLIKSAFQKIFIYKNDFYQNIFERAWLISLILLTLTHLFDVTYFDGRISIAGWILLAGVRNINKEKLLKNP